MDEKLDKVVAIVAHAKGNDGPPKRLTHDDLLEMQEQVGPQHAPDIECLWNDMVDANERAIDRFLENPPPTPRIPGVISALAELEPDAVVTEESLTHIFGKHTTSIKRAVERGELPRPIRMFGKPTWTVKVILTHLEERMRYEAETSDESAEVLAKYRPDGKG
jgi:hypothetical protein